MKKMDEEMDSKEFNVLIVDDNAKNIQVLGSMLQQNGYHTAFALNGREAIERAEGTPFDLILLDVMMPGMDGVEVCRHLKRHDKTKEIPIIFLTAKTDTDSVVKGFEMGACDYVIKPFIAKELMARVKSQLQIKSLNDELRKRYEEIKRLEEVKETMTNMLVHDLRNPLSAITGYAEMLTYNNAVPAGSRTALCVDMISRNCSRLLEMTMNIIDISKLDDGEMAVCLQDVPMRAVLEDVEASFRPLFLEKSVEFFKQLHEDDLTIRTDREILRRVLANVMGNAVRFAPKKTEITCSTEAAGKYVRIAVSDQGPGIPKQYQEQIFQRYKQGKIRPGDRYSRGLGLAFCKMAVESLKGEIGVESDCGEGSTFWLSLPVAG